MKKTVFAAAFLACLGAAAYFVAPILTKPGAPPYRTVPVEKGEVVTTVSATGTINAVTTVLVGSQVSGTIQKIYVDYNSRVRKGQPIAELDPRVLQASLEQAQANFENARAGLERAKVAVADAARTLRRNRELIADGFIAQSEVDAAQTAYDQAVAQQKSAEAQISQTRAALTAAETNRSYATILAPVDGIVISRSVDVGQTVAASFQTPTLFTIAEDLTKMQIDTNVGEADIASIKEEMPATFTVDAYPAETFSGVVRQVRNAPIVAQNVVSYDVVVRVGNEDLRLKPGMTANVTVPTKRASDVLKVPNAALRYRPSGEKRPESKGLPQAIKGAASGPRVHVLDPDGKTRPVPVKVGISDGTFTEIAEGKLKEGDLVIVDELRKKSGASGGRPPGMGGFR